MLDNYLSAIETMDEVLIYCQYVESCCFDIDFLDNLDIDIVGTNWDEPRSGLDFNNVAVMSLIIADNCDDSNEKGLYLEYAIEALQKGIKITDSLLCKAHLAIVYVLLEELDKAKDIAYRCLSESFQKPDTSLESGLIYLPTHSEDWKNFTQAKLPEILILSDGNKQALSIMSGFLCQVQTESKFKLMTNTDPLSLQHRHSISNWIANNNLEKILDFGGGFGTLARMITEKNSTTRVDIYEPYPSEFAVSRCSQYSSINFVSSMKHNYDCIVSTDVLEHVTTPLHLFEKLIQSLRIGGYLIIANCFYPIIKCHLPLTFHLRYTFDRFAIAMGLEVIGNCTGSHATIYKKLNDHPVNWEKIERMSLVSKRLFFLRELQ